jgi:uncharacterized protein (TIGR02466 family)
MNNIMFGTPLWVLDLAGLLDNDALEREGIAYQGGNYFDLQTENVLKLKIKMKQLCDDISIQYRWRNKPTGIHGIQRPIFPKELDTPHYHQGPKMIAVYYIKAEPNCGDILFHDPRGGTDWPDLTAVNDSNGKTQRTYHRVTPKPGMLVMFPSYLIHSVEPNYSDSLRLSIAMSIYE